MQLCVEKLTHYQTLTKRLDTEWKLIFHHTIFCIGYHHYKVKAELADIEKTAFTLHEHYYIFIQIPFG